MEQSVQAHDTKLAGTAGHMQPEYYHVKRIGGKVMYQAAKERYEKMN